MASGIYKILCSVTGLAYYGSTTNLTRRKAEHFCALRKHRHGNHGLQEAHDLYGAEALSFVVVEGVPVERLFDVEQQYLDSHKDLLNIAHNAKVPGLGGRSKLGQVTPIETRKRIGDANRGKKRTKEVRNRISEFQKVARRGENNGSAKLDDAKVRELRQLRSQGMIWKDIASHFGISYRTAFRAGIGESWGHIT